MGECPFSYPTTMAEAQLTVIPLTPEEYWELGRKRTAGVRVDLNGVVVVYIYGNIFSVGSYPQYSYAAKLACGIVFPESSILTAVLQEIAKLLDVPMLTVGEDRVRAHVARLLADEQSYATEQTDMAAERMSIRAGTVPKATT